MSPSPGAENRLRFMAEGPAIQWRAHHGRAHAACNVVIASSLAQRGEYSETWSQCISLESLYYIQFGLRQDQGRCDVAFQFPGSLSTSAFLVVAYANVNGASSSIFPYFFTPIIS